MNYRSLELRKIRPSSYRERSCQVGACAKKRTASSLGFSLLNPSLALERRTVRTRFSSFALAGRFCRGKRADEFFGWFRPARIAGHFQCLWPHGRPGRVARLCDGFFADSRHILNFSTYGRDGLLPNRQGTEGGAQAGDLFDRHANGPYSETWIRIAANSCRARKKASTCVVLTALRTSEAIKASAMRLLRCGDSIPWSRSNWRARALAGCSRVNCAN